MSSWVLDPVSLRIIFSSFDLQTDPFNSKAFILFCLLGPGELCLLLWAGLVESFSTRKFLYIWSVLCFFLFILSRIISVAYLPSNVWRLRRAWAFQYECSICNLPLWMGRILSMVWIIGLWALLLYEMVQLKTRCPDTSEIYLP